MALETLIAALLFVFILVAVIGGLGWWMLRK